jgi:rhomboid protease GluP
VTYALLAAIGISFAVLVVLGGHEGPLLAPPVESLVAFGGLSRTWVLEHGQWYRLASAAFLHGGLGHLVLNGLALYLGGTSLEPMLGRRWLLAIFGLGVLGGGAASLALDGPEVVSVGASGAIMCLLATAFLVTFRLPRGGERRSAQLRLLGWLVPALIPLASHPLKGTVDYAAHLGGTIVGLALGAAVLATWRRGEPSPRLGRVAGALAAAFAAALVASVGVAFARGPALQHGLALSARLAPDEGVQKLRMARIERREAILGALLEKHPGDPRLQHFSALLAVERDEPEEAEAFLRRGLSDPEMFATFFPDGKLERSMRALLARLLLARRAEAEAREAFRPACGAGDAAPDGLAPDWVGSVCGK